MSAHRARGVPLKAREEPLVKVVRGNIHEWRKQSAIKGWGSAASLHALYHRDVLGKHNTPGGVQVFTPLPIGIADSVAIGIIKLQSLPSLIYGL